MTRLIACDIQRISTPSVVVCEVPVANRSGATYALADGRKWVRKRVLAIGEYGILAEAVGWLMSKQLGLPVPDTPSLVERYFDELMDTT